MDKEYKYPGNETNAIKRSTLREALQNRIDRAKERIVEANDVIEQSEAALKMLNKNKELETLVNLLRD